MLFRKPLAMVIRWVSFHIGYGWAMGQAEAAAKLHPVSAGQLRSLRG